MSKPRAKNWFSTSRHGDHLFHATEAAAKRECLRELKRLRVEVARDNAWEGIEIPPVLYGPVTHRAVGYDLEKIAPASAGNKAARRQKLTMERLKAWHAKFAYTPPLFERKSWWNSYLREALMALKANSEADAEQALIDAEWGSPGDNAAELRRKFKA